MAKPKNETVDTGADDFPKVAFVEATEVVTSGRGRKPSPRVLKIRDLLDKAVADKKVVSMTIPSDDKDKWDYDIRRAAKITGLPEIKIGVRYNVISGTLSFGPRELFAKAE